MRKASAYSSPILYRERASLTDSLHSVVSSTDVWFTYSRARVYPLLMRLVSDEERRETSDTLLPPDVE